MSPGRHDPQPQQRGRNLCAGASPSAAIVWKIPPDPLFQRGEPTLVLGEWGVPSRAAATDNRKLPVRAEASNRASNRSTRPSTSRDWFQSRQITGDGGGRTTRRRVAGSVAAPRVVGRQHRRGGDDDVLRAARAAWRQGSAAGAFKIGQRALAVWAVTVGRGGHSGLLIRHQGARARGDHERTAPCENTDATRSWRAG